MKLKSVKRGSEPIGYALNVIKVLFTENEIKQGIFPDNKGKNRSKFRIPFDKNRTEILKGIFKSCLKTYFLSKLVFSRSNNQKV